MGFKTDILQVKEIISDSTIVLETLTTTGNVTITTTDDPQITLTDSTAATSGTIKYNSTTESIDFIFS